MLSERKKREETGQSERDHARQESSTWRATRGNGTHFVGLSISCLISSIVYERAEASLAMLVPRFLLGESTCEIDHLLGGGWLEMNGRRTGRVGESSGGERGRAGGGGGDRKSVV